MAEILFLTNCNNDKKLFHWIVTKTSVEYFEEKLSLEILKEKNPKLVISYNYNYIVPSDCIEFMNKRIINLHISFLPWNKGASPNIWSIIDNTPKGVTIHEMTSKLDEGNIIFQKEVLFNYEHHTLATSYETLNQEIVDLFIEHWDEIYSGNYVSRKQSGIGSYHTLKDLNEFRNKVDFEWSDKILDFLDKINKIN